MELIQLPGHTDTPYAMTENRIKQGKKIFNMIWLRFRILICTCSSWSITFISLSFMLKINWTNRDENSKMGESID